MSFLKRDEFITKTLNVISLTKKEVIGKILIKIKILNSDMNNINNSAKAAKEVPRSSSAIPLESRNSVTKMNLTVGKNGNSNIKNGIISEFISFDGTSYNILQQYRKKANLKNNNYSTISCKNSSLMQNKFDEKKEIEQENLDNSRIETLFDDEKISGIENVAKNLEKLIEDFKIRYKENFDENPEDLTIEGYQKIIYQFFELQDVYCEDFEKASSLNSILKSYLRSYSENYRIYVKKNNRLNEAMELTNIRNEFSKHLNIQNNQRILDSLDIVSKEIKIFKHILKVKYNQGLFQKYKDDLRTNKCIINTLIYLNKKSFSRKL